MTELRHKDFNQIATKHLYSRRQILLLGFWGSMAWQYGYQKFATKLAQPKSSGVKLSATIVGEVDLPF